MRVVFLATVAGETGLLLCSELNSKPFPIALAAAFAGNTGGGSLDDVDTGLFITGADSFPTVRLTA
jgi:hypothetical protein